MKSHTKYKIIDFNKIKTKIYILRTTRQNNNNNKLVIDNNNTKLNSTFSLEALQF